MTSAWKLLYIWKSRSGRSSEPAADPASDSSRDSNLRRPRHRHGHGSRFHQRDDPNPNPLPRSQSARTHARNLCHRASQPEHVSVPLDRRSSGDLETRNGNNGGVSVGIDSRVRLIRNNQLPDAVVQARERLVERLRGVSLAGTSKLVHCIDSISWYQPRESTTASGVSGHESALSHDSSNNNFVDREDETLRDWSTSNLQYVDLTLDASTKKISKVSWEALCTLYLEVFRNPEEIDEVRASPECCICLESFCRGDGLIRLHCGHRFHPMCLQPWVRTCSDCPYCRSKITC